MGLRQVQCNMFGVLGWPSGVASGRVSDFLLRTPNILLFFTLVLFAVEIFDPTFFFIEVDRVYI